MSNQDFDFEEPCFESDAFIEDSGPLGSRFSLSIEQKFIGEFESLKDLETAFADWTEANQFYPSLWYVDDHGGLCPYVLGGFR